MDRLSQDKFKRKLGKKIAERRTELGLTQEQLAHSIGKDKQFINRYELNGANPTAYNLKLLADNLQISLDELLDL